MTEEKDELMTREEYDLMWELIDKAFMATTGKTDGGSDYDELFYLIPSYEDVSNPGRKEAELNSFLESIKNPQPFWQKRDKNISKGDE